MRVEHQRPQRRVHIAARRRHPHDHGFQHVLNPDPLLGGDADHVANAQQIFDFLRHFVGAGGGQINLVDHRDDFEVLFQRQIHVCQRLRLDPLRRIHHQHRAFAGLQRPADLVAEIDVPRRVDQVDLVLAAVQCGVVHAHRRRLDGDAALALQIHAVEQLILHIAVADGVRELKHPVGERAFPVIDVGDDAKIANVSAFHAYLFRDLPDESIADTPDTAYPETDRGDAIAAPSSVQARHCPLRTIA